MIIIIITIVIMMMVMMIIIIIIISSSIISMLIIIIIIIIIGNNPLHQAEERVAALPLLRPLGHHDPVGEGHGVQMDAAVDAPILFYSII